MCTVNKGDIGKHRVSRGNVREFKSAPGQKHSNDIGSERTHTHTPGQLPGSSRNAPAFHPRSPIAHHRAKEHKKRRARTQKKALLPPPSSIVPNARSRRRRRNDSATSTRTVLASGGALRRHGRQTNDLPRQADCLGGFLEAAGARSPSPNERGNAGGEGGSCLCQAWNAGSRERRARARSERTGRHAVAQGTHGAERAPSP